MPRLLIKDAHEWTNENKSFVWCELTRDPSNGGALHSHTYRLKARAVKMFLRKSFFGCGVIFLISHISGEIIDSFKKWWLLMQEHLLTVLTHYDTSHPELKAHKACNLILSTSDQNSL